MLTNPCSANLHDGTNELRSLSLTDFRPVFCDSTGRTASNAGDLIATGTPDEAAMFSVLQLGAIVPPLSPWREISRLRPGYVYRGAECQRPVPLQGNSFYAGLEQDQQADALCQTMDQIILQAIGDQADPVVLFSGGVDSGFLAARLAAMERRDTLLLNFSFGEDDPESKLAEAMAQKLGLRFERLTGRRQQCACLADPGKTYPLPFADHSTVPASDLACAVIERLNGERRVILDGTGADGAFGMGHKIQMWKRVLRLPQAIRWAASGVYSHFLWHRTGKLEHRLRVLRRGGTMPALSAALAQNPLAGIVYHDAHRAQVLGLFEQWIAGSVGDALERQIVAADLALICANTFTQKAQPILQRSGLEVCYPFLHDCVVDLALQSADHPGPQEPKALLKSILARQIPKEMVYRPKSAFADVRGAVFYEQQFISYLRAAGESSAPLGAMLKKSALNKACDLLTARAPLPVQTRNCLWAIVFLDRWYRTAQPLTRSAS